MTTWDQRLSKAHILVFGGNYSSSDQKRWSQVDPHYIVLGYSEGKTDFKNSLDQDWNCAEYWVLVHKVLHDKRFKAIYIDRGSLHKLDTKWGSSFAAIIIKCLVAGGTLCMQPPKAESSRQQCIVSRNLCLATHKQLKSMSQSFIDTWMKPYVSFSTHLQREMRTKVDSKRQEWEDRCMKQQHVALLMMLFTRFEAQPLIKNPNLFPDSEWVSDETTLQPWKYQKTLTPPPHDVDE